MAIGLIGTLLAVLPPAAALAGPVDGDAIFAVLDGGALDAVAVRRNGAFLAAPAGEPNDRLRTEANAAIANAGGALHLIFGGRVIATVPARVANGAATVALPPSLALGGHVEALASPTLGGDARHARRPPTAAERAAALGVAARKLGTTAPTLTVRNLTALDLGHGMALVGSVDRRGPGTPRTDARLFFVAEPVRGALALTLADLRTVTVTEPLLEDAAEYLVDAVDLGDGALSLVTVRFGYDAHTYAIYGRRAGGWRAIYSGGGAAL